MSLRLASDPARRCHIHPADWSRDDASRRRSRAARPGAPPIGTAPSVAPRPSRPARRRPSAPWPTRPTCLPAAESQPHGDPDDVDDLPLERQRGTSGDPRVGELALLHRAILLAAAPRRSGNVEPITAGADAGWARLPGRDPDPSGGRTAPANGIRAGHRRPECGTVGPLSRRTMVRSRTRMKHSVSECVFPPMSIRPHAGSVGNRALSPQPAGSLYDEARVIRAALHAAGKGRQCCTVHPTSPGGSGGTASRRTFPEQAHRLRATEVCWRGDRCTTLPACSPACTGTCG